MCLHTRNIRALPLDLDYLKCLNVLKLASLPSWKVKEKPNWQKPNKSSKLNLVFKKIN